MSNISDKKIYTVSQVNLEAQLALEQRFGFIWVEGEVSNFSRPASGHIYFSLKDESSQIRCAFFRNYQTNLKYEFKNGDHVLVKARVSLYTTRGDYQLIIEEVEPAGLGKLQLAFDALKKKLQLEGLFDLKYKKEIPAFPTQIGVITSHTGAALRDILKILRRRCPLIPIIIYPTPVQGEQAANSIIKAIQKANQHNICDILILARGGGSLEDLWCFNEENVARSIFNSKLPIVTGIGHEIDFTIADFVADQRAPTPSAAAELVSPSTEVYLDQLNELFNKFYRVIQTTLQFFKNEVYHLTKRLRSPKQYWMQQSQRLDDLEKRLTFSFKQTLKHQKQRCKELSSALDHLSPLKTLDRGYAIVTDEKNKILRSAKGLKKGDTIQAKLAKGQIKATVTKVNVIPLRARESGKT